MEILLRTNVSNKHKCAYARTRTHARMHAQNTHTRVIYRQSLMDILLVFSVATTLTTITSVEMADGGARCIKTNSNASSWRMDLGAEYHVKFVEIINRPKFGSEYDDEMIRLI